MEIRERKGTKSRGSVVRRNARHPQFTSNQRRECFVAVQGDEPDVPFIPRCHRRIISPRARTGSSLRVSPPGNTWLGEAPSRGGAESLRGTRDKHTLRITIPKNRSATLVCARSVRVSTIYGRHG